MKKLTQDQINNLMLVIDSVDYMDIRCCNEWELAEALKDKIKAKIRKLK